MADKKTGKSTASHKKAVKEFQKEGNPDFQKSGGLDFQPRASAVFQEKTGASQKPGASKSHAKKEYGETEKKERKPAFHNESFPNRTYICLLYTSPSPRDCS